MFVHGDEGLIVLKGNVKNTMLGDRGWNPVPAVLAMPSTPRGAGANDLTCGPTQFLFPWV